MRTIRLVGFGAVRIGAAGIALVLTTAALVSCASPTDEDTLSATEGLPDTTQALEAHTWVLDADESTPRIDGDATITLAFDDPLAHGRAPCNTYRGRFSADGDSIEIGPLSTTLVGCDESTSDAERTYLTALEAVDSVDVTDPTRLVLDGDDDVHLVYGRVELDDAVIGTWDVTSINTGDALMTPRAATTPTLEFAAGGELTVDAGCNPMSTTWTLDGSALAVEPVRSGMKECPEPSGVMEQERALSRAVEDARSVEVTDHLVLYDDEGRIVVEAVPAGS